MEKQSGAAGSATFAGSDSRQYNYYKPKGRKATLYEDVTVDVQPDPERYLIQDWIISFANGDPAYNKKLTAMKSSDWHEYRAPDEEHERNHFARQSEIEETIKIITTSARARGAAKHYDSGWVKILQDHVGALKHPEHGLGSILLVAQRDGLSQMINNSILTNSSYKLRFAQDIALYLAEVSLDLDGALDEDAGKDHWLNDPLWQGARKAIETIGGASDHLEQYFAINVIYEALVTEPFRSGFVMQCGAMHGDFVTPAILATGEGDYERNLANTIEMFYILSHDPTYGEENKQTMQGWLAKYVPLCREAAHQLQPIWSQPQVKRVQFSDAWTAAKNRINTTLNQIDVSLPKEVQL
jgi:propane monooxygenase small subunit